MSEPEIFLFLAKMLQTVCRQAAGRIAEGFLGFLASPATDDHINNRMKRRTQKHTQAIKTEMLYFLEILTSVIASKSRENLWGCANRNPGNNNVHGKTTEGVHSVHFTAGLGCLRSMYKI